MQSSFVELSLVEQLKPKYKTAIFCPKQQLKRIKQTIEKQTSYPYSSTHKNIYITKKLRNN